VPLLRAPRDHRLIVEGLSPRNGALYVFDPRGERAVKWSGLCLVGLGALVMVAALLYSPIEHYSLDDRWDLVLENISTHPNQMPDDFPAQAYSPERAQLRELGFWGGGICLLSGVILFAVGVLRASHPPSRQR
jgi:hypothetical protein